MQAQRGLFAASYMEAACDWALSRLPGRQDTHRDANVFLCALCGCLCLQGQLSPMGKPSASLQLVREISMLDVGRPLLDVALVPPPPAAQLSAMAAAQAAAEAMASANGGKGGSSSKAVVQAAVLPRQCVLLRWGGLMSALDLEVIIRSLFIG